MTESNLVYDAFQNRIMFPLANDNGQVVAFSGRIWEESPPTDGHQAKYKNSRSTAIFNKSYELYHFQTYILEDWIEGGKYRDQLDDETKARVDTAYQEVKEHVNLNWQ